MIVFNSLGKDGGNINLISDLFCSVFTSTIQSRLFSPNTADFYLIESG